MSVSMRWLLACAWVIFPAGLLVAGEPVKMVKSLEDCDLTWNSPSTDSFGSMPLGNGDVGLNVWVEKNGDLLLYISKVDAFDSGHLLPKLGRVRVRLEPAMPVDTFQQTLVLRDGAIAIRGGDVNLRVWVDANSPIVRVEGTSTAPRQAAITLEPLRKLTNAATPADAKLPGKSTAGILLDDKSDRLTWCYRNMSSAWAERLKSQNSPEMVAKAVDPILHRTSGCLLQGEGLVRVGSDSLALKTKLSRIDCSIRVLSMCTATLPEWVTQIEMPVKSDWAAHQQWWQAFWDRSHIFVSGCGEGNVNLDQCRFTQFAQGSKAYEGHKKIAAAVNAFQLSQRYALERFCEAIASRGVVPPPYNGSIFTMDMPAGVMGFNSPKPKAVSPDGRDWAVLSFMWQNTRHPYWSMATRGDYDTIRPGMQFVRDGLEIGCDRCKKLLGIDGAFIMEASWWHNVGVFNWNHMPGHLRYHQLATIETPAIMCEYYEHTRERRFLDEVLLPCADEFVAYYANRFTKRDANGRMLMAGVGCAETYQGVTNPCTEMGCLKFLLTKLLSFEIDDARRGKWGKLLGELPGVPMRRVRGMDLLAVGDAYDAGREICESPELYSIYPFRQVWVGKPELLGSARQSFHVRNISIDGTDDKQAVETGGWQSSPVQAAYLGLGREAARLASINFNDRFIHWTDNVDPGAAFPDRPRARFPAFWECKMDGTPDNDHGANSVNTLQSMLLQSDGKRIFLLPAWPENWDVSFKLHAGFQTTVECVYREGKVQSLKVTPEGRRGDVVDMSSYENRVRTLVEVACGDRNYLFDLPPMLDGQVTGEDVKRLKTTGAWLEKYGESLYGMRSGPFAAGAWGGSVFKGNVVYLHVLDWGSNPVVLPGIQRKLVSARCLTGGEVAVRQSDEGISVGMTLAGKVDGPDSVVRLEFDGSVEAIAMAAPYRGSLTRGEGVAVSKLKEGGVEVDLGRAVAMDRFEIGIENPGYRRGGGVGFEIQAKQADGSWTSCYKGKVYGSICGKRMEGVTARVVRLKIDGAGVKCFDLFAPGQ